MIAIPREKANRVPDEELHTTSGERDGISKDNHIWWEVRS
jgi:hypothetical protein